MCEWVADLFLFVCREIQLHSFPRCLAPTLHVDGCDRREDDDGNERILTSLT